MKEEFTGRDIALALLILAIYGLSQPFRWVYKMVRR